ncbi:hypothetical protein D9756_002491 [Leucocoprinus leucothites]|uniref:C2H2-type domain-containing protein n=1 Tax=Leucocoprinus leucothites TaxID=201217 RepID=A0A8H5LMG8_9AGAR|nr:hypothetical protein D9756_002491 [Leucoagaricus leucothites]
MSPQPAFSPSSYHPYSHLRSRTSTEFKPDMQHRPTMSQPPPQWTPTYAKFGHPYPISVPGCADCSPECTESMCSTSGHLTSQCTDQCVVIACSDPEHSSLNSSCDFICDSEADCAGCNGLDAFIQCCDENHPCHVGQRQPANFSQQYTQQHDNKNNSWYTTLTNVLHDSGRQLEGSSANTTSLTSSPSYVFPSAATDSSPQYPSYIANCQPSSTTETYGSIPPPFSPSLQSHDPQEPQYHASQTQQPRVTAPSSSSPPSSASLLTCMWGNCHAQFTSLAELVGHVNLAHLRTPTDAAISTDRTDPAETQAHIHSQQVDDATRLPCLWGGCTEYLQPQQLAGTSSTRAEDIMFSRLASHLFQDHLGLQHFNSSVQSSDFDIERMLVEMLPSRQQPQGREGEEPRGPQYGQSSTDADSGVVTGNAVSVFKASDDASALQALMQEVNAFTVPSTPSPRTSATAVSSPATSSTEITSGEGHVCLWESCGMSFETCDDLMSHMSAVHVGSGKPQYDCLWEGCTRNGEKGFSSRQKICRHLQSHTGYRPFQCPECLQNFSEAATLQQHIRRHTQESECISFLSAYFC